MSAPERLSFLAPPREVSDWRMSLLYDLLDEAGVLDGLPGTAGALADRLGLDAHGVRVLLDALGAFGIVGCENGTYSLSDGAPTSDEAATLALHARSMRLWCAELGNRLRGVVPAPAPPAARPDWLDALAVNARSSGPLLVDACLARFPDARRVLDLGGGHGEHAMEFTRRGLYATLQDRPPVIDYVRGRGTVGAADVHLFAGDFHEVLPDGPFDLIFCAGVTHTMSGARNRALYARLRPVVAPGGGLAISTFLRNRSPIASIFALQMLAGSGGGDTFAEEDYAGWLTEAGFEPPQLVDVADGVQTLLMSATN